MLQNVQVDGQSITGNVYAGTWETFVANQRAVEVMKVDLFQ